MAIENIYSKQAPGAICPGPLEFLIIADKRKKYER
jgi:hypothetical protein